MYRFRMAIEDYKPGRFEYPLEDKDKYNAKIQFEIVEQLPPEFKADLRSILNFAETERNRETRSVKVEGSKPRATGKKVDLYVPQAHSVADVFVYDNPALGISGGALAGALTSGTDISSAVVDAAKQGLKGVDDLIGAFGGRELGRAAVVRAAAAAPFVPQNIKDAVGIVARTSLHPNLRTRFQNVGIRQFSFNFRFIPKSADEAAAVKQIVNYFRYHAYPEEITATLSSSGIDVPIAYKYPDMFRIKLFTRSFENGNLVYRRTGAKMLDCFLNSITTTYNPTAAVYHYDGEPVETDLTLNFMEHRPLSRSDVDKPLGSSTPEEVQQQSGPF